MQAEKRILQGLFWCIAGCLILATFFEFHFDTFIKYPVFLKGHRDFVINVFLGGFASAIVSFVMTLLPYLEKKDNLRDKMYLHVKSTKEAFEKYHTAISDGDYAALLNSMQEFEDCMTKLLECYHSQGVTLFEYKCMEEFYCKKIIGYSTHIMSFNSTVSKKSDKKIKHLFDKINSGISDQVYKNFIEVLDKWLKKYEKRFVTQPSDDEVHKWLSDVADEYNKLG